MSAWNKQELLHLIAGIAPGRSTAEAESDNQEVFLRNFLPIPDHRRALEPDILLILGGRGAGKTQLFRALALESGRRALAATAQGGGLPELPTTHWLAAFGRTSQRGRHFPPPEAVADRLQDASDLDWRAFWLGMMLGVMVGPDSQSANGSPQLELPDDVRRALAERLPLVSEWFPLVRQNLERLNHSLDQLDTELEASGRWLFISYDELDRLVPDYLALAAPIRELLALWLDRSRRWARIRPKIFLRTDLLQPEFLKFPDASKLQGHQTKIEWQAPWLYQLVIKRLANSAPPMRDYCGIDGLVDETNGLLGVIPRRDERLFEDLMSRMVGRYMGANARKGFTYRWIPNHLQDTEGRIAPRSFLKLFSLAAEKQLGSYRDELLADDRLLLPTHLQGALQEASEDRIRELQEEYPWLEPLTQSLRGLEVPANREDVLDRLRGTQWPTTRGKTPPTDRPDGILDSLMRLGIAESRQDGRINVAEIYLYGFGLKRRGGIKRPKYA